MEENNAPETLQIPEEYKDRGWASQLKSMDDVFKKIDNQDKYISKGQLPHKDSNADDLSAFAEKMKKYTSNLDYSELVGDDAELAKALKDEGVPVFQAKSVVNLIKSRESKNYSEEEFAKLLDEKFKGRGEDLAKAKAVLKEVGEEKTNALLSKRNDIVADVMDIIAEIGKKYEVQGESAVAKLSENKASGAEVINSGINADYYREMQEKYYNNPQADESVKRAIMKKYKIID
jgi:rRNA-processing protein FCF1